MVDAATHYTRVLNKPKMRVGILTGGGDAPGLNAVIRAAVKTGFGFGWEMYGIREGFEGFFDPQNKVKKLKDDDVAGILHLGGTILGTTIRGNPFEYEVIENGKKVKKDRSDELVGNFKELGLDALIAIGGDGSLAIAQQLFEKGVPVVGVPKTIDNDLSATVVTFGFDTAVSRATEALDWLHSTAKSHERVMVVEVMGRYAGWIALNSGVSGGADVILIPEIPFNIGHVCEKIQQRYEIGRRFAIVVCAEGATFAEGGLIHKESAEVEAGRQEVLLGGIAERVAAEIANHTGRSCRHLVLGHLQRGGHPTTFDRLLATRFGHTAAILVRDGNFGRMVALDPPDITSVPIKEAIGEMKLVPATSDVIASAKDLGISFGDEPPRTYYI
jgi:6-phosphofructokinase 1